MDLKQVSALLLGAAAVVGSVFLLFNSLLNELVPPTTGLAPNLYASIASLSSLLVLLVTVLTTPARPTLHQRRWISVLAVMTGIAAFVVLWLYMVKIHTYVFSYPEITPAGEISTRHIRGQYTELGEAITKDMNIAAAIDSVGKLGTATKNQLLWTEESQKKMEVCLVSYYVVFTMLITTALFCTVLAILRSRLVAEANRKGRHAD